MTAATTTTTEGAPTTAAGSSPAPTTQQTTTVQDPGTPPAKPAEPAPKPAEKPYEFKAPDGASYDPETIKVYGDTAKELGITVESAQKMLDRLVPALQGREAANIASVQKGWADALSADQQLGGPKLTESMNNADKALTTYGTQQLRELFDSTGLSKHPEIVRLLNKVHSAVTPDTKVVTGAPAGVGREASPLARMAAAYETQ